VVAAHGENKQLWVSCMCGRPGILPLQISQKPLGSAASTSQMCKRFTVVGCRCRQTDGETEENTTEPSRRIYAVKSTAI